MALLFGDSQIAVQEKCGVVATSIQSLIGGSRRGWESAKTQATRMVTAEMLIKGNIRYHTASVFILFVGLGEASKHFWYCLGHLTSRGQSFFDDMLLCQHPPSLGFLTCQSRNRKVFQLGKISPAAAPCAGWSSALA